MGVTLCWRYTVHNYRQRAVICFISAIGTPAEYAYTSISHFVDELDFTSANFPGHPMEK
jgi:hypothetical protein